MSIAFLKDTDETKVEHAREVGLSDVEFENACTLMGRIPNKVELGIISAMWSEHCSYKSSRRHLAKLPSEGENVLVGPGENAGIVDIGDGLGLCFKVESHNHPSFIEPVEGSATGIGGILRDVFTMGARPIAAANLLRFGSKGHPKTPHLLRGVVKGIGDYGNCFGVPTVYSDVDFNAAYDGNILVNAFALGVVEQDKIFLGRADGTGNSIFYVGAKTGRDGIHGATMASDSFSEDDDQQKRPTVQVGDAFKEKLLLEACQECFGEDVLIGIQDMGAAGLTSSIFEMASRSGSGVKLHLDLIPVREEGMTGYEKMLSESQERMVLVAKRGAEERVSEIFHRWGLDCKNVGEVTDDGMVRLFDQGIEIGVLPARPLADEAPSYDRPHQAVEKQKKTAEQIALPVALEKLLDDAGRTNLDWVYEQYDRQVGANTLVDGRAAAAAVVQIPGTQKATSIALVCQGRKCKADAKEGAAQAVYEAALRVACTGAEPLGVSDCLNFGNPENKEVMQELVDSIEGIADACQSLEVPVISGNVSLYNETDGVSIHPTPTIAMVGLLDDASQYIRFAPIAGDQLFLLGRPSLSTSGGRQGLPSVVSWDGEDVRKLAAGLVKGIKQGVLSGANPTAHAGLWHATLELCLGAKTGASLVLDVAEATADGLAFGADSPAVLVSSSSSLEEMEHLFPGLPLLNVGEVGGATLELVCNGEKLRHELMELKMQRDDVISDIASGLRVEAQARAEKGSL